MSKELAIAIMIVGSVYLVFNLFSYCNGNKCTLRERVVALEAKIDQQSARTDRLYEMFIDLLKEKK